MKKTVSILLSVLLAAWGCCALAEGEDTTALPTDAPEATFQPMEILTATEEVIGEPPTEGIPADILPAGDDTESAAVFSGARSVFASAAELYGSWGGQYPDYVAGVWSNDGTMDDLTIAVVSEEAKARVLEQLEPDAPVTLAVMPYSYKELRTLQETLTPRMGEETGIIGLGVLEMENVLEVTLLDGAPHAGDTAKTLAAAYGDRVKLVMGDAIITMEELGPSVAGAGSVSRRWAWLLLPFALALALTGYSLLHRRAVLRTSVGTVETAEADSVARQVREAKLTTSARLDEKILTAARKK